MPDTKRTYADTEIDCVVSSGEDVTEKPNGMPFVHDIESGRGDIRAEKDLTYLYTETNELAGTRRALISPRKDWPQIENKPLGQCVGGAEGVYEALGCPSPMPRWESRIWQSLPSNRLISPMQHFADVHSFLLGMLDNDWATFEGLQSMLKVMLYGLETNFAKLKTSLQIRLSMEGTRLEYEVNAKFGTFQPEQLVVPGDHGAGYSGVEEVFAEFEGRPFVVGFIHFSKENEDFHWASFLFDRVTGTFYFYDSMKEDRQTRFEAAVLSWRMFLDRYQCPYEFTAVCVPMTPQTDCYSCGYLCLFALWIVVKGLCGLPFDGKKLKMRYLSFIDGNSDGHPESARFPLPDWNLWSTEATSKNVVWGFLAAACVNELGVTNYYIGKKTKSGLTRLPMCDQYLLPKRLSSGEIQFPGTKKQDLTLDSLSPLILPPLGVHLHLVFRPKGTGKTDEQAGIVPLWVYGGTEALLLNPLDKDLKNKWAARGQLVLDEAFVHGGPTIGLHKYNDIFNCQPPVRQRPGYVDDSGDMEVD